jgi:uncharacterized protein YjdB
MSIRVAVACVALAVASGCVTGAPTGDSHSSANPGGSSAQGDPVRRINVSPAAIVGTVGQTTTVSGVAVDSAGTPLVDSTVAWTSDNTAVATVSSTGSVHLMAAGSATLTAAAGGMSAPVPVTVARVAPVVAAVTVTPSSLRLVPGAVSPLTALPVDSGGRAVTGATIAWHSSVPAVASVSSSGVVTGATIGNATVTATAGGHSASASVVVVSAQAPVASVTMSPATLTLTVGQSGAVTATPVDSTGASVPGAVIAWSSSNTSIATVANGTIRAIAVGMATISAASAGKVGQTTVTVVAAPPPPVSRVVVSPTTATLTVGQTTTVTAAPQDSLGHAVSGATVTWASSATGIATVTNGTVRAIAAGTATISATSQGKAGQMTVTVRAAPPPSVARVVVTPATASITAGQTTALTAVPEDSLGRTVTGATVTWTTSNASAATVAGGTVTGVAAGTATITATSQSKTGSAAITVTAATASATECATPGAGWIFCDDFEQDRSSSYFEVTTGGGHFARVAGVGVQGSTGMRVQYVPGTAGAPDDAGSLKLAFGRTPSTYFKPVDAGTANYREVYWRVYVRNQPGWVGGGGDKLSRAVVFATSNWAEAAFAHVWSGVASEGDANQLLLDPASGTDLAGTLKTTTYNDFTNMRWLGQTVGPLTLFDNAHVGQWYCVEAHAKLNDAGASNGVFELWINGTLQAQHTGLNWLGSFSDYGFNAVFFENYWNAGTPVAQDRYLDDIVVSTQPIGCKY